VTQTSNPIFDRDATLRDLKHNILEFKGNIELAAVGEIVETTPDVIAHFNPKGLGQGNLWFNYAGRIVCETGKTGEVERILDLSREEMLHGTVVKTT
jgi:hypothetical protein